MFYLVHCFEIFDSSESNILQSVAKNEESSISFYFLYLIKYSEWELIVLTAAQYSILNIEY